MNKNNEQWKKGADFKGKWNTQWTWLIYLVLELQQQSLT